MPIKEPKRTQTISRINRHERLATLVEEIIRIGICDSDFTTSEITKVNATLGDRWGDIGKQQISSLNLMALDGENSQSNLENFQTLTHEREVRRPLKPARAGKLGRTNWFYTISFPLQK